jgi:hypothetical protein
MAARKKKDQRERTRRDENGRDYIRWCFAEQFEASQPLRQPRG